jgi:hypothetical protein
MSEGLGVALKLSHLLQSSVTSLHTTILQWPIWLKLPTNTFGGAGIAQSYGGGGFESR